MSFIFIKRQKAFVTHLDARILILVSWDRRLTRTSQIYHENVDASSVAKSEDEMSSNICVYRAKNDLTEFPRMSFNDESC